MNIWRTLGHEPDISINQWPESGRIKKNQDSGIHYADSAGAEKAETREDRWRGLIEGRTVRCCVRVGSR